MGKSLTLILGGARSGKSSYAQKLMDESGKPVLFVATATAGDDEMAARIRAHQDSRPKHWTTLEAPVNTGLAIQQAAIEGNVLLDCVTLLVSNVLMACPQPLVEADFQRAVQEEVESLLTAFKRHEGDWVIVSNEVGLGVVPATLMGRFYRDALGRANQQLAASADRVIFMVSGIPMKVK
ncbi:bifunctional adenosylcobinamide kinase/adenosylcobinamide-phosphate guanylyltransferase [Pelolinea submarina]|uniref:Adenosylcobinamide kinase n=1 Tax=Pelolinea submarina TaxID=913107 RepID=A0A347ZR76_9CHLR|nr:bifunctional adenosylcobinamide kinase/adenosylcobinamide-phosphate guanylyltransferase [Pelolinea submarina]REG11639.1 adenosylcobinamide kinase /adenosylcobinamide-phosphate guanylyltransferase [Pelolinea submarina]BBB47807.1 adenosylcobinamide kinase /adenosylcobinamide-phosphate guanylyltransferase [Pelolinea submarina]